VLRDRAGVSLSITGFLLVGWNPVEA
jgi:hypothetical protein